jgi:hypothetical protein
LNAQQLRGAEPSRGRFPLRISVFLAHHRSDGKRMADRSARTSFSDAVNSNTRHDASRYAWMKANYLIAAGITMASWLFLIAWIVSRII